LEKGRKIRIKTFKNKRGGENKKNFVIISHMANVKKKKQASQLNAKPLFKFARFILVTAIICFLAWAVLNSLANLTITSTGEQCVGGMYNPPPDHTRDIVELIFSIINLVFLAWFLIKRNKYAKRLLVIGLAILLLIILDGYFADSWNGLGCLSI
jgi:ABC-type xylose transport system permease subunit